MIPGILRKYSSAWPLKDRLAIARQFYPSKKEHKIAEGFSDDPMGEKPLSGQGQNFIHKYTDRILILSSQTCPVLCRFCTRKRVTFNSGTPQNDYGEAMEYIRQHPEITEIIFSGGDPFMQPDEILETMMKRFLEINRNIRFRFHTRAITMIPERFTESLFPVFRRLSDTVKFSIVMHVNHPREITPESLHVINQFKQLGIPIKTQTVLLKNINDHAETLKDLFRLLASKGVQPYYLHQLDRVTGSAHFEVTKERGISLVKEMQKTFPACLIPPYVIDGPLGKKRIL